MKSMVCFRTDQGKFAVPVAAARAVRLASGLVTIPEQRSEIAGVLPGNPPLTVLAVLGDGGDHVLVLESHDIQFGLQVREVYGVTRVQDDEIRPGRVGGDTSMFVGTLQDPDALVLIVDADEMATRL